MTHNCNCFEHNPARLRDDRPSIALRPRRTVARIIHEEEALPLEEAIKLALLEHGYKLLEISPEYRSAGGPIEVTFCRAKEKTYKLGAWTLTHGGCGGDADDWLYNAFLGVLREWEKKPVVGRVPGGEVLEA